MAFDLSDGTLWVILGVISAYRVLDGRATYAPDDPFPSTGGRFSDGHRKVLYLAISAEAAMAEWLRHHSEFLSMQAALRVRLSEVQVEVPVAALDVRTSDQADKIPFPFARLVSSDADEGARYAECRELAGDCDASAGLACPNAAYAVPGAWNVVLFGERGDRWVSHGYTPVDRPDVDPALVRLIEAA